MRTAALALASATAAAALRGPHAPPASLARGSGGAVRGAASAAASRRGGGGDELDSGAATAAERAALVALGRAAGSGGWVYAGGWLSNAPHCDWDLVGCSDAGRVTVLSMPFNNLTGTLPDSLGDLSLLQVFNVESNALGGTVPAALGGLAHLQQIGLGGNRFTGLLPAAVCDTPAANGPACDFSRNRFACPLPHCAAHCSATCAKHPGSGPAVASAPAPAAVPRHTDGAANAGQPGDERAALVAFARGAGLGGWRTRGGWLSTAPVCDWELVGCDAQRRVKLLTLAFNNLTGTLSPALAELHHLQTLDVVFNTLAGRVPDVFSSMPGLLQLGLGANRLTGLVPASLCAAPTATAAACNCFGNSFSCPLPACLTGRCKLACK